MTRGRRGSAYQPDGDTLIRLDRWKRLAPTGMSVEAIASQLGIKPRALNQLVLRARRRGDPAAVRHPSAIAPGDGLSHLFRSAQRARRQRRRNAQEGRRHVPTYHPPEETRGWTAADLDKLIGAYVVVEVPASDWFRSNAGPDAGDYEGGSGVCIHAGLVGYDTSTPTGFVDWDYGMGWSWPLTDGAHVSVCRNHGDHDDEAGLDCLTRLGVRGGRPVSEPRCTTKAPAPQEGAHL